MGYSVMRSSGAIYCSSKLPSYLSTVILMLYQSFRELGNFHNINETFNISICGKSILINLILFGVSKQCIINLK